MTRRCTSALAILVGMALLGVVSNAQATTMRYASVEELYQISDTVVRATIVGHETFWTEEAMFTDWHLVVHEVIAGDALDELTVRQLGGELDGTALHIPGDARLRDGQQAVFFLAREGDLRYLSLLGQSVLELQLDIDAPYSPDVSDGSGARLHRDLTGITFYAETRFGPTFYHIDEIEVLTLDQVRAIGELVDGLTDELTGAGGER